MTEAQMTGVAFVGATLIDGTGSRPLPESAVVIRDGRIAWVGAAREMKPGLNVRVTDVSGKYIIPGLMDANVHLVARVDPEILLRFDPGDYDELVIEAAQVALRAGITTVFDTWGPLESLGRVQRRIDANEVTGSRFFFAGNIIGNGGPWSDDFVSYHGVLAPAVVDGINHHWEHGVGSELPWMSADDVRRAVREYIATNGVDFVKYASSPHGPKKFIALSPDAQRAIVEEAHAAGLTAQACAMTGEALKLAIDAGVDLLQHGNSTGRHPMPRETLELIVARQLPCVAALYTERYIDAMVEQGRNGDVERLLIGDVNARALIRSGARLMLAIDGGVLGPTAESSRFWGAYIADFPDRPYQLGTSHVCWLRAAIERGMAPMDALLAATRNIADGYHKGDELGTVEAGKRADLLVLEANPLDDVENYERIVHVIKDGALVDRRRLPARPVLTQEVGDRDRSRHLDPPVPTRLVRSMNVSRGRPQTSPRRGVT